MSEDEENDDDESVSSPSIDAQWDAAFKAGMNSSGSSTGSGRKSAVGGKKIRPKSEFRH